MAIEKPLVRIQHGAITHKGRVRMRNEDVFRVNKSKGLFLVADGMGGMQDGHIAAQDASAFVSRHFHPGERNSLQKAFRFANDSIFERNQKAYPQEPHKYMGTTLTGLHVAKNGDVQIAHYGDTRLYLLRGRDFGQLTLDHATGNLLSRAVGLKKNVWPDIRTSEAKHNDVYLLCSDGLTRHVYDGDLQGVLEDVAAGEVAPHTAARKLVSMANRRGGKDNITALVVRVLHRGSPAK